MQSPNSCTWNPWLPAASPLRLAFTATPPGTALSHTVPSTLLPWVGLSTATARVTFFGAAGAAGEDDWARAIAPRPRTNVATAVADAGFIVGSPPMSLSCTFRAGGGTQTVDLRASATV